MSRIALDTNVLAYFAGIDRAPADGTKIEAVRSLIAALKTRVELFAPLQALGELFGVLLRSGAGREDAHDVCSRFARRFSTIAADHQVWRSALDLAAEHRLEFWDALIIACAAHAGCPLLLSEDMQDGFAWRGLTVVSPFSTPKHPRLAQFVD